MKKEKSKQFIDKIFKIIGKFFSILVFYVFYKSSKYNKNQYYRRGYVDLFEFMIFTTMTLILIIKDISKLFKYEENYKTLLDKYKEYKVNNPEKTIETIKGIKLLIWLVCTTIFFCIIVNIYEKY